MMATCKACGSPAALSEVPKLPGSMICYDCRCAADHIGWNPAAAHYLERLLLELRNVNDTNQDPASYPRSP